MYNIRCIEFKIVFFIKLLVLHSSWEESCELGLRSVPLTFFIHLTFSLLENFICG